MTMKTMKTFKTPATVKTLAALVLLLTGVQTSWAEEGVKYIERSWNGTTVVETEKTCTTYKLLESSTHTNDGDFGVGDNPEWDNGGYKWVVVRGYVELDALLVQGEGHLILTDGAVLKCTGGIILESPNKLYIYSQSSSSETQGRIIATQSKKGCAGIGGRQSREVNGNLISMGTLEIHGGNISATGAGNGAGIGGGEDRGIQSTSYVAIYGGHVWAEGGKSAAGIGGGYSGNQGGPIRIYGGEVHANGGYGAAGIGGGNYFKGGSDSGEITIYGGDVQAFGGDYAAGIGGGDGGDCTAKIVIKGGKVLARSGSYAAGIGGGYCGGLNSGVEINIEGGEVDAQGRYSGPGIGVGTDFENSAGQGTINISGNSIVRAKSEGSGAGIGCGYGTNAPNVNIVGNSSVEATGSNCSAAIGAGKVGEDKNEDGATLSTYGGHTGYLYINTTGTVILRSNNHYPAGEHDYSDLQSVPEKMILYCGTDENSLVRYVGYDRIGQLNRYREGNFYIRLEPCTHPSEQLSYSYKNGNNHTKQCKDCLYAVTEEHDGHATCVCGYKKEATIINYGVTFNHATLNSSGYTGESRSVAKGSKVVLPDRNDTGLVFMGWDTTRPTAGTYPYLLRDNETPQYRSGDEITITGATNLYARYILDLKNAEWTWDFSGSTPAASVKLTMGGTSTTYAATVSGPEHHDATDSEDAYDLYTAAYDHVFDGYTYHVSDQTRVITSYRSISLYDNSDNTAILKANHNRTVNATLTDRTLFKDGSWNTLCLPFDVTTASGPLSGDGVVAQVLDAEKSSFSDDGKLALTFKDAPETIPAGLPFIIKWSAGGADIVSPTFENVTVTVPQPSSAGFSGGSFVGQFSPFQITDDNINAIILLTDNNTLGYSKSTRTLHSCRAHFEVVRNRVSGARLMTGYSITFGPGAEAGPTAISAPATEEADGSEDWYTLGGQRLGSRPVRKGIYVRQGRKVVIK